MNIKKRLFHRCLALILVILIACFPVCAVNDTDKTGSDSSANFEVVSDSVIENESFRVEAQGNTGAFVLTDKNTGSVWHSNPEDREAQTDMKGINKMQMNSQLIVEYLVDDKKTKQSTSFASATNKKGVTVSADKNGLRFDFKFVAEKFTIPLLIKLDDKGLIASILCDEIKEEGDNKVTKIAMLPYFGAAGKDDSGYFLVPDGSGALINFNNGKIGSNYQQEIYDTDGLMNIKTKKNVTQIARLPIFGIQHGADTLLSIIEDGDTVCRLFSYVSGTNGNYNYIYPQFTYRQSAVVGMLSKTWYPIDITFISPLTAKENFTVRYMPLGNENGGYSKMATAYREYLEKKGDLEKQSEKDNVPLYLDVYGSALVSENILGIPLTVNRSLTSFEETKDIITELNDGKVGNINIRYLGISSAGLENKKIPTAFKPASSIGGKKGFDSLVEFAEKNSTKIYPDVDFINFKKPTFSMIKQLDAAKDVCDKTGVFYEFDESNGNVKTGSENYYVLKPKKVERAVEKFFKSYEKKTENKYLSLSTLASFIYADFGDDIHLAEDTVSRFNKIMGELRKEDISLMLESPNAYAFATAGSIISAPTGSSNFDIEDVAVPFYQMVLHGYVSYSTESVNLSVDSRKTVLKAIETGSSLMYSISAAEYSVICYDDYDHLYSITAKNWMSDIIENQKMTENALKGVSAATIVGHEIISDGVVRTVYDNGVSIIVNYNNTSVTVDEKTVDAQSYLVI